MEQPLNLTILYTANIQGDIHMLPRLYTFMQTLKPAERQGTIIVDLGNSCAEVIWHCDITQGRSTLMVLDAMGYHAANVEGLLEPMNRKKVANVVTMGLVDGSQSWHYHIPPVTDETIQATFKPIDDSCRVQICLSPKDSTGIEGNVLYLANIPAKKIGVVHIDLNPFPKITHNQIYSLPDNTPPNPTIVASVEFVESEARYFQKKQSKDNS